MAAKIVLPDGERRRPRPGSGRSSTNCSTSWPRRADWPTTNPADAARVLRALAPRVAGLRNQIDELEDIARSPRWPARDELRGRLDAYRAKAQAVGRGEDLELDRLYVDARDVLYSAPCDLVEAGALVTAYQRSISSPELRSTSAERGTAWPNA